MNWSELSVCSAVRLNTELSHSIELHVCLQSMWSSLLILPASK